MSAWRRPKRRPSDDALDAGQWPARPTDAVWTWAICVARVSLKLLVRRWPALAGSIR